MALTFAEEILLLLLDDERGTLIPIPDASLKCAMSGAALMDLALLNRVDSDLHKLFVVDASPTGNPILDPSLAKLAAGPQDRDSKYWVQTLAADGDDIRETALLSLVNAGILRRQDEKFLWVFATRRYPAVDGKADREVKLRLMGVLLADEIPDPHDIALLCLADACGIFDELLGDRELESARPRIEQVRKMDLIGQAISKALWDIQASIAIATQPTF
jgi:hypothetical protein